MTTPRIEARVAGASGAYGVYRWVLLAGVTLISRSSLHWLRESLAAYYEAAENGDDPDRRILLDRHPEFADFFAVQAARLRSPSCRTAFNARGA
jgi:hypothetical protein